MCVCVCVVSIVLDVTSATNAAYYQFARAFQTDAHLFSVCRPLLRLCHYVFGRTATVSLITTDLHLAHCDHYLARLVWSMMV